MLGFISLLLIDGAYGQKRKRNKRNDRKPQEAFGGLAKGGKNKNRNTQSFFFIRNQNTPSLEVRALSGGSLLMGDFGGQIGPGQEGLKDADLMAIRYSIGSSFRIMSKKAVFGDVGINHLRLFGNDELSQEPSRKYRDSFAAANVQELKFSAYLKTREFAIGTFSLGIGGFSYRLNGEAGLATTGSKTDYNLLGYGWITSFEYSFSTEKYWSWSFGAESRIVFNDKMDNYIRHRNDSYFTLYFSPNKRI